MVDSRICAILVLSLALSGCGAASSPSGKAAASGEAPQKHYASARNVPWDGMGYEYDRGKQLVKQVAVQLPPQASQGFAIPAAGALAVGAPVR